MIIQAKSDPIGQAIFNYYYKKDNTPINVFSKIVEEEQLPPDYFFRTHCDMPLLERLALKNCAGKVLDIGAGAGCHSLYLQSKNIDITSIEISKLCCDIMKARGVNKVENSDILTYFKGPYDTILLLMNGIGISGTKEGLGTLLKHLKLLIKPNGKILLDSSDLIYLYEEEDGTYLLDINAENYYGEIEYRLNYKNIIGEPFSWLFADNVILSEIAEQNGFKTKVLEYGPHFDYLAELTLI